MLHRKIKIVFKFLKLLIVDTAPSPDHESISGYPVKETFHKMLSTDRCHVYFSPRDIDRICSPLTGKKSIVGIENMSPSIDIFIV